MNTEKMAHIIADPTALTELQKCASVHELVARLNWAGAECTPAEGLRFLRTWEDLASEREPINEDELEMAGGSGGIMGSVRSLFARGASPKRRAASSGQPDPLTIEMILKKMYR